MTELGGLQLVITRPRPQAEPWAIQLRELGAQVDVIPLLEIIPVQQPEHIQAIKNCILDFDLYSKAIFVSQNAVEFGFEWLENYWPQLPIGIDFFAVGETTAKLIERKGARVTDLAFSQSGAMTSEALLQAPALQQVSGEKMVIFRGLGGRTHLGDELRARGARVDYCELYERCLPEDAEAQFAQLLQQPVEQRVILLHSGEALENLIKVITSLANVTAYKMAMQLLVPSQRIKVLALEAGFVQVCAAQNATDAAMLQGLAEIKRNLKKV